MEPRVLDGGFATQLSKRVDSPVDGTPLWSSSFLATDPQACLNTHLDFLQAGAEAVSTNTYQASVEGFVRHLGLSPQQSLELMHSAVRLARDASRHFLRERNWSQGAGVPWVVGSVGPYGATLNDGSEYSGSYTECMTEEQLVEWHRPRLKALVDAGVDVLALETLPALREALALLRLLREVPGQKAWISFSCKDERSTSHGEPLAEAVGECWAKDSNKQLVALGCNCLAPALVSPLFQSVRKMNRLKEVPLVVYPNSGEVYSVHDGWSPGLHSLPLESYVSEWLDVGVKFLGGCCRTYPQDISRLAEAVTKWRQERRQ